MGPPTCQSQACTMSSLVRAAARVAQGVARASPQTCKRPYSSQGKQDLRLPYRTHMPFSHEKWWGTQPPPPNQGDDDEINAANMEQEDRNDKIWQLIQYSDKGEKPPATFWKECIEVNMKYDDVVNVAQIVHMIDEEKLERFADGPKGVEDGIYDFIDNTVKPWVEKMEKKRLYQEED